MCNARDVVHVFALTPKAQIIKVKKINWPSSEWKISMFQRHYLKIMYLTRGLHHKYIKNAREHHPKEDK